MKIAYQGEPGAFSEAASRLVSADAALVPCKSFEDVFAAVEQGPAAVRRAADRELDRREHSPQLRPADGEPPADRRARWKCRSSTTCSRFPGATLTAIKRVYSHPQALAQCERFLRTLSGIEIIATYDTAGSAKMVSDGKLTDTAAIASARAGEIFGLSPLASSIQDFSDNITRFIVIGRRPLIDDAAGQDDDRLFAAERAGIAVQGAQRVCAARRDADEARIAADSRPAVGIPVLRRPGGGARRDAVPARARQPGRVRAGAADARFLSRLERTTRMTTRPNPADGARAAPRGRPRDAEGRRLQRRRSREAAHRRRQHVD